jgi:hypothetical protein
MGSIFRKAQAVQAKIIAENSETLASAVHSINAIKKAQILQPSQPFHPNQSTSGSATNSQERSKSMGRGAMRPVVNTYGNLLAIHGSQHGSGSSYVEESTENLPILKQGKSLIELKRLVNKAIKVTKEGSNSDASQDSLSDFNSL